nr:hypothetical protein [Tanacetum cinerariifolium]
MTSSGYHLNPRFAFKECSSCGALYTEDFCCSKGNVEDKIVVPKPLKNCARCENPVNGPHCQGCALLREIIEEDLVSYFYNFQNIFESSDDSTNVVNAPREPVVVKQDHGVNPPHIDKCCYECDEVIKFSFEDLVPILSESKGIPDTIDDDSLYKENIEYVEASPHDFELVSLEAAEIVILGSTTTHSDISLLDYEAFSFNDDHIEEISSGSTTTHSDISLLDYEAFSFNDDHIEEISSGSTTTHSDISFLEYDSFIFDLTHEEFADELAHIISPPEYPVIPPYLHPFGNEDSIFYPGITINRVYSFKTGLSHR